MVLAALSWAVFAVLSTLVMRPFVRLSAIGHAGGNRLRRDLWPHRLHRQSRRLPRGYLVEGASGGLQTCIVPLLSYNCAAQKYARCRETVHKSPLISASLMLVGAACFILLPGALIGIFSRSAEVLAIGRIAFPTIGASFPSAAFSLIMPAFFQAIGCGGRSLAVTLTRRIFGLLPVFWLLSLIGLNYTWLAFPVAETAAGALGYIMYRRQLKVWK